MQNISVIIIGFILMCANLTVITANAVDLIDRTPSPADIYDLDGNLLDQITIGHQAILSKTFVNNMNVSQPFVAVFDIRDSNGFTVYVAWQSGTMAASGQANVGISWIANDTGIYEIRTFHLSNLTNLAVIDTVETKSIPVVEDAGA